MDAIVLVFDLTQADSYEGVLRWFKQIRQARENCPIIILGNKSDDEEGACITESELDEVSHLCQVECL